MARSKPAFVRSSSKRPRIEDKASHDAVAAVAAPPASVPAPASPPASFTHAEIHAIVQRVKEDTATRAAAWVSTTRERWAAHCCIPRWRNLQVFARHLRMTAAAGCVTPLVAAQCTTLVAMLRSACHEAAYMQSAGAMFPHAAGMTLVRRLKVARDLCVRPARAGGVPVCAGPFAGPLAVAAHQASAAFVTTLMSAPALPTPGVAPSSADVEAYVLRHVHSVNELGGSAVTDPLAALTFTMEDDFLADLFARDYGSLSVADVAAMCAAGASPSLTALPFDCHVEIARVLTQVLDSCVNARAMGALPSTTLEDVVTLTTIWEAFLDVERAARRQ